MSFLTVTTFPTPINTLHELSTYNLPVAMNSINWREEVASSEDPAHQAIAAKAVVMDPEESYARAANNEMVTMANEEALDYRIRKDFTNK